jgi:HK97 family phage prohead protease
MTVSNPLAMAEREGRLEGYAAVKNQVDRQGDVIADGAFSNLADFIREGFVTVAHRHERLPIGYIEEAREDDYGLWIAMRFHQTAGGQSAYTVAKERLAAGKTVGLSIGYVPRAWRWETRGTQRVRRLTQIDLREFSLVTVPAMPLAQATQIKTEAGDLAPRWPKSSVDELNPARWHVRP